MSPVHRLLVCLLISACHAQKDSIMQKPPMIVTTVNSEALIDCEQVTTDHNFMYWYYRRSSQGLKLIALSQRDAKPNYEDDYEKVYEVGSTRGYKQSYLKIKKVASQDEGVYFCASSGTTSTVYFGSGTVVRVLGAKEEIKPPKVSIYLPSKQEVEDHNFISLVCVASDFFPEHVNITWFVDGVERVNLYKPVPQKKTDASGGSSYSTSKRLTLTRSEYFNPDSTFQCQAAFLDGSNMTSAEVKGETDCSISKETYTIHINQGKISYIMILCKSGLYALVVLALLWRKKVIFNSY